MVLLAAAALGQPAQALTKDQRECLDTRIPAVLADTAVMHDLTADPEGEARSKAATEEIMRKAVECGLMTGLSATLQSDYTLFALGYHMAQASQRRLEEAGYPLSTLTVGLQAMVRAKGDPALVFSTTDGLTPDGIAFMLDYFSSEGKSLATGDPAVDHYVSNFVFGVAAMVERGPQLGEPIFE